MLFIPAVIPKYVQPGLRAVRPKQPEYTGGKHYGIWVPCRIFRLCPHGCNGVCIASERERRCQGELSATCLGIRVDWRGAALAAEISEDDASKLEDALFRYDFDLNTEFTQPIALARYLKLTQNGEILRYVKGREETDF